MLSLCGYSHNIGTILWFPFSRLWKQIVSKKRKERIELGCGLKLSTLGMAGGEGNSAEPLLRRKLGHRDIVQRDRREAQLWGLPVRVSGFRWESDDGLPIKK